MIRRTDDDRRDTPVAAVTQGPDTERLHRFTGDHLNLPILIVAAVKATDTSFETFIARLRRGAIWQDQSLRSADRDIDIQAYLAPEGLRCAIRVGRSIWYHHPLETLHAYGMPVPTVLAGADVPLGEIVNHPLLDSVVVMVTGIRYLNATRPDLGICMNVTMPMVRASLTPRS